MIKFKDILLNEKKVKLPKILPQNVRKRIENFSYKISKEDGTKYEKELERTYEKLTYFLNKNEIYKYGIVTKKDSNTTFKNLEKKGINIKNLENEFNSLGYRYVISYTAGLNRVNFESEKAIDIGFKQSVEDMFKQLKKEGYDE